MTFEVNNLSLGYQTHLVLRGVTLRLNRRELTGVLGANGAGKSTLLVALAGDLTPQSGQVLLDSQTLSRQAPLVMAQKRAVLSQQPSHAFNMTVAQLLELGFFAFPDLTLSVVNEITQRALAQVSIDVAFISRPLSELSGGQLQRVHIARALTQLFASVRLTGQGWLLLDEPLASLDPLHQQQLLALCQNVVRMHDVGILLVLHDLNLAVQWCDRLVLLGQQQVLSDGATSTVLTEQNLRQAYGMSFHIKTIEIEGVPRTLVVPGQVPTGFLVNESKL
jgi:iron complex transport system ATP-binding protein